MKHDSGDDEVPGYYSGGDVELDNAKLRIEVERLRGEVAAATTPRPLDEWHEDDGVVLWWRFPISEPPYVGTPLDDDWPVYATYWTRLLEPDGPTRELDRAALGEP